VGERVQAGRVSDWPGNRHMTVKRLPMGDVVVLNDEVSVNRSRPSVELFYSIAWRRNSGGSPSAC